MYSIIPRLTHKLSTKTELASGAIEYLYIPDQELFNRVYSIVTGRHTPYRFPSKYVETLATYAMSPDSLPCRHSYLQELLSSCDTVTGESYKSILLYTTAN
jgi:hypothetical protein